MYFSNNKIIFVHIPKTGGSSLEYFICKSLLKGSSNLSHDSYKAFTIRGSILKIQQHSFRGHSHSYISEYKQFLPIDSYLKFTVLRNPFDQAVSLYNQIKGPMDIPSLEYFIMSDEKNSFLSLDHYINQYDYTHINGELCVDKVFVFDRYHEAQDFVDQKFNIKIERDKKLWKTIYSGESWSKEMKEKFESKYYKSIDLYHRYLNA